MLLRRWDDPGLRRLTGAFLPVDQPARLAEGIARGSDMLFDVLSAQPGRDPLGRIARGLRLSAFDLDLLGLAALPCLDEDAGQAVAAITSGPRRLTLGLAIKLLIGDSGFPAPARAALRGSPLWRLGALADAGPGASLLETWLEPTQALLAGLDGVAPETIGAGWRLREVLAEAQPGAGITRAAGRLTGLGSGLPVHLAGQPGRAEQVLAAAGGGLCLVFDSLGDASQTPPWAEAHLVALASERLTALRTDAGRLPGPPAGVPAVAVVAPASFSLSGPATELLRLDLGGNDPLELADAWCAALGLAEGDADELAGRNWLDPGSVRRIADNLPVGEPGTAVEQVLKRVAALTPPHALRLATRRMPDAPWDRLIVPRETGDRLTDLARRVRRRVTVHHRWGLSRGERGRGVSGLFHGDSGTGKTLAAEALATRLALPMLAVDLSLVVSKYIGETEKNLAELFTAAEGFAALLFFDEADALFGRRTNVQDAHDRYANIEVNFLLQRLEAFEGLAVLSTNLLQGVDEAFLRRFDQVVQFPRPGVAERNALWQAHLPAGRLASDVRAAALAARFELTGGEIRNAALGAAFVAADSDGVVTTALLEAAVADELMKKGRPFPGR
jgi:hypothetical protein